MDADLRLRPPRPGPDLTSDPDLLALITAEIRRAGPITFARFMELALYAPELGYYTSPATRIGRDGDFLTAPETHPIFGAAVARQVAAVWHRLGEPATFVVREYGVGTGALAASIVAALRTDAPDLAAVLRYEAVEINPTRRQELEDRQSEDIMAMSPADAAAAAPTPAGLVLANEFFDAFAVHRVEQTPDGLREVFVTTAGTGTGLAETLAPPSTNHLAERLNAEGVQFAAGQRAEIAFGHQAWFAEVGAWLQSGLVVVIDYGDRATDLYGPRRRNGTLLGYVGQQAIDDPLAAVGRQDLTAHVDFTAVEGAATVADFTTLRFTTQSQYLVALGLEALLERARSDPNQSLGQYLELRSSVVRLLDPRHTGGFRVLALGRHLGAELPLPGA